MTRQRAEFLSLLLAQGVPLERESIAELVAHALATAVLEPSGEAMDLGVKEALRNDRQNAALPAWDANGTPIHAPDE